MINVFKALNPLNILWLAILLFALRVGYLLHLPGNLPFAFADPFSRVLLGVNYQYAFPPLYNVFACRSGSICAGITIKSPG